MKAIGPRCVLGEGPLWHPQRQRLYWFDIPAGRMHVCNALGGQPHHWDFGEPASAAGWVDYETLIVATASGFQRFDIATGRWETLAELESDNQQTRSNDGRIGPDGSFWLGTMSYDAQPGGGGYYRYRKGRVETLMESVGIPNATCFSPDRKTAYLADGLRGLIWRWALDRNCNPVGNVEIHIDLHQESFHPDGAVCDSEGYLWKAQWDASRLARYAPDGSLDRVIELPVSRPTCPAFGGTDFKTLYVTSASEGLSDEELEKQKDAGRIIRIEVDVPGFPEHRAIV